MRGREAGLAQDLAATEPARRGPLISAACIHDSLTDPAGYEPRTRGQRQPERQRGTRHGGNAGVLPH